MNQPTTNEPAEFVKAPTFEIERDIWIGYLGEFTRENRGAHAQLEVLGNDDIRRAIETQNRPFEGISADVKDGEDAVWITLAPTPAGNFTHGIQKVTAIRVRPPAGRAGAAVEIDAEDGTTTLLELSRPEDFELPPVTPPGRNS
jgi:hypothetical protein